MKNAFISSQKPVSYFDAKLYMYITIIQSPIISFCEHICNLVKIPVKYHKLLNFN